ncbi:hypothetical protein VDG1235_76 [Verrucomicrobiia bacterium DG1235]|nr:hypothetical protein VDG1235_76 [Verrucomicrobiae bacterium DG1235]
MCRRAFDLGVTHFDLANNYGPPAGSAESNFGDTELADIDRYADDGGLDLWAASSAE